MVCLIGDSWALLHRIERASQLAPGLPMQRQKAQLLWCTYFLKLVFSFLYFLVGKVTKLCFCSQRLITLEFSRLCCYTPAAYLSKTVLSHDRLWFTNVYSGSMVHSICHLFFESAFAFASETLVGVGFWFRIPFFVNLCEKDGCGKSKNNIKGSFLYCRAKSWVMDVMDVIWLTPNIMNDEVFEFVNIFSCITDIVNP